MADWAARIGVSGTRTTGTLPSGGLIGPQLRATLERYGLQDLAKWLSAQIINGASDAEIELGLREHPVWKQRFWMIEAREKAGMSPISPDEVVAYEAAAFQSAQALGVTVNRQQIGEWIAADKGLPEMQERMGMASAAVYQSSPHTRAALNRLYGVTDSDLADYWLDPKKGAQVLARRFAAAQIAGVAAQVGFDTPLSQTQAEGLFEAGMDPGRAAEGFGQLVEAEELFEAVDDTEQDIDVDTRLELLTGNADVAAEVERRGERRTARFREGGGFAAGREGMTGIGRANRR